MQYSTKGFDALLKDFLPMRYKQQTVFLSWVLFTKARIIKGGDNSFPAARGCQEKKLYYLQTWRRLTFLPHALSLLYS